jgi:ABC-type glycerol-3-phosphate transport system substrate-binding protein
MQDVNRLLTVGNRLAWAFSDEMLSVFENTLAVFFNKKQADDLQFDDLYELVRGGGWTFDKFFEYAAMGIKNISGGNFSRDDYWGIVAGRDEFHPNFWIGAGIDSIAKDESDIPYFSLPGNERFLSVVQKTFDYKDIDGMYMDSHSVLGSIDAGIEFFKNGQAVFLVATIQEMINLRDMPDDFGVMPFPKYDAQQPRHHSRISGGRPFIIPTTNERTDIAGALMEVMAYETRNYVYPAYYESSLQQKFARDADTVEMLDLVRDTLAYDLGDTVWEPNVRGPLLGVLSSDSNSVASWIERNEDRISAAIQKTVDAILDAY